MKPLATFKNRHVTFVETMHVKDGVECDVYSFVGDDAEDLAIVRVTRGFKTPLQKILQGEKTVEGYLEGKGTLTVQDEGAKSKTYHFDSASTDKEVEVR